MNVAGCVHPLAAFAPASGPAALAVWSGAASILLTIGIWLRLLGMRAREAQSASWWDWLLPLFAAPLPTPRPQTRSLGRPMVDRAPLLLRAPPAEAHGDSPGRNQCAPSESLATPHRLDDDDDTPPPPPPRRTSTPRPQRDPGAETVRRPLVTPRAE
jgi:hypothetical protein